MTMHHALNVVEPGLRTGWCNARRSGTRPEVGFHRSESAVGIEMQRETWESFWLQNESKMPGQSVRFDAVERG